MFIIFFIFNESNTRSRTYVRAEEISKNLQDKLVMALTLIISVRIRDTQFLRWCTVQLELRIPSGGIWVGVSAGVLISLHDIFEVCPLLSVVVMD